MTKSCIYKLSKFRNFYIKMQEVTVAPKGVKTEEFAKKKHREHLYSTLLAYMNMIRNDFA